MCCSKLRPPNLTPCTNASLMAPCQRLPYRSYIRRSFGPNTRKLPPTSSSCASSEGFTHHGVETRHVLSGSLFSTVSISGKNLFDKLDMFDNVYMQRRQPVRKCHPYSGRNIIETNQGF